MSLYHIGLSMSMTFSLISDIFTGAGLFLLEDIAAPSAAFSEGENQPFSAVLRDLRSQAIPFATRFSGSAKWPPLFISRTCLRTAGSESSSLS